MILKKKNFSSKYMHNTFKLNATIYHAQSLGKWEDESNQMKKT